MSGAASELEPREAQAALAQLKATLAQRDQQLQAANASAADLKAALTHKESEANRLQAAADRAAEAAEKRLQAATRDIKEEAAAEIAAATAAAKESATRAAAVEEEVRMLAPRNHRSSLMQMRPLPPCDRNWLTRRRLARPPRSRRRRSCGCTIEGRGGETALREAEEAKRQRQQ